MRKEFVAISKYLAYILRHHPEKIGIHLDAKGFADLEPILMSLNQKYSHLGVGKITKKTLEELIRVSDKLRYEIQGEKIRALYGHSLKVQIEMEEPEKLPAQLFHGTTPKAYAKIKTEGLIKRGRQYVHLSKDKQTAELVGKRRTTHPIILVINVQNAKEAGIPFYKSGDMFLAEEIPPEFITKM